MKIHSAYLQNQIPENANQVRPVKEQNVEPFKEVLKNQPTKPGEIEKNNHVKLELSQESQRILSFSEKETIAQLFAESNETSTYDRLGKSSDIQLPIGNRIDVKG